MPLPWVPLGSGTHVKGGLGRRKPKDWKHVETHPLTATTLPPPPTPVVLGINWYSAMDSPVKLSDGRWWVGRKADGSPASLGNVRGGHCIAIRPESTQDTTKWVSWYNQGSTGECVGFGSSRAMSWVNRRRYDPVWLYMQATLIDEYPGDLDPNSGTSVRAAMEILRTKGHRVVYGTTTYPEEVGQGISAYRWATTSDQVLQVLGQEGRASSYAGVHGVPLVNSWGSGYPATVWLPLTVLDRLLSEDGEAAVPVDK